jgi:hypothetical protein
VPFSWAAVVGLSKPGSKADAAELHPVFGQLQSSLNGGSDGQGGMDELLIPPPAPPLDTDTPLDP